MTKVHIGPNGDQQRVFVEQEFSNENELKKFVKNLKSNFEKSFHQPDTNNKKPKYTPVFSFDASSIHDELFQCHCD